jgi:hypothetical protein
MYKLLNNWIFDSSKLVSFVNDSDKYNFTNAKLYLTTCKHFRCSYTFILKLLYK